MTEPTTKRVRNKKPFFNFVWRNEDFDYMDKYIKKHFKPPTKAQLARWKKEEIKKKKRRAKKITMTVGEYEDALDKIKHDY